MVAPIRIASAIADRRTRIRPYLVCPLCQVELADAEDSLNCSVCQQSYPIRKDKIYFITPLSVDDQLDSLKGRLKRMLGRFYYSVGVQLIGPSFPFNYRKQILTYVDVCNSLVVDIGSGNQRISENVVRLDGIDYEQVDIVADLTALPFKTGSIDCFASRSVLEHVPELNRVIEEIKRCTRIGGLNVHHTPFLFPYHASPHDYQRFTHTGITNLFKGWELIEQVNVGGPVSLFLILMTEFGSILLSGGNQKLKPYIYLSLCVLLFPLKFVDILFIRRKSMLVLAPTMVTVLRRP